MAVTMLVGTAGLQAFCYAGFHSYTQDVASKVRSFAPSFSSKQLLSFTTLITKNNTAIRKDEPVTSVPVLAG